MSTDRPDTRTIREAIEGCTCLDGVTATQILAALDRLEADLARKEHEILLLRETEDSRILEMEFDLARKDEALRVAEEGLAARFRAEHRFNPEYAPAGSALAASQALKIARAALAVEGHRSYDDETTA